jgi:hypothetical protein
MLYIILLILAVFLPESTNVLGEEQMLEKYDLIFSFGLFPGILAVCSVFTGTLFSKKAIEVCVSSDFKRTNISFALNIVCHLAVLTIFFLCYLTITITNSIIGYNYDFQLLRILLACVIVFTNSSFALLITFLTKSPMLSTIITFFSINIVSLICLLSVNIFHNGYAANYFTTMAIANVLVAQDYTTNYAVTFLLYLLFGILFTVLGIKYFVKCDFK